MTTVTPDLDQLSIDTIRTLSIDGVQQANSGHPGAPMGAAPMAYAVWTRFLRHAPTDPHWPDRDRFVLSAGHASMLLYSLLHLTGYARLDGRPQVVPPVGQHHAGAPGARPHARRRSHDRSARPGPDECGRHGHRGTPPRRRIQRRRSRRHDRRPLDLRHRLGRRPPGGRGLRGGQPGRPPAARQARRPVRRQPHPARWADEDGLVRGCPGTIRGVRLAHPARRRRQRCRGDHGRHRGGPGRRPAEPHRRPDPHRLRQPEQAGLAEGARRPARAGRGPPHEGGLRLGSGPHVLRPGRRRRPLPRGDPGRRGARGRVGGQVRGVRGRRSGPGRRVPTPARRAISPTAGTRT